MMDKSYSLQSMWVRNGGDALRYKRIRLVIHHGARRPTFRPLSSPRASDTPKGPPRTPPPPPAPVGAADAPSLSWRARAALFARA